MPKWSKLKDTLKEVGTLGFADTQTYNPDKYLTNNLEDIQGASFAWNKPNTIRSNFNPDDTAPLEKYRNMEAETRGYTPTNGSTVSKSYLDYASPIIDDKKEREEEENNKIKLKDLQNTNQLSEEDVDQLLQDSKNGVPKHKSFANMVAKKRYQLGTRLYAPETIKEANLSSIFDKSELKTYLTEKNNPVMEQYITTEIEKGRPKQEITNEITLRLLHQDVEDALYEKKNWLEKSVIDTAQTLGGTGVELVASIPRLAAFVVNAVTWDGIEQNDLGRWINEKTDQATGYIEREGMGMDTGELSGDMDNSLIAGKTVAVLIDLVFGSKGAKNLANSRYLAKMPKLASFMRGIVDGLPKLEEGAKMSEKTVRNLQRLGLSAIRNGLFSVGGHAVGEGKAPDLVQGGIETGFGVVAEGALGLAGRGLSMLGAKIGIGDLLDKSALNRIRGAMEDAGLPKEEVSAMDVWGWLKERGITKQSTKKDMLEAISDFRTRKSADTVTKNMDNMRRSIDPTTADSYVKDDGDIAAGLKKVKKKILTGEDVDTLASDTKESVDKIDELINKLNEKGGLNATEANQAKRLMDDNLDMYTIEGGVKKKQENNANLRKSIKEAIEKEADKLGIDIRSINKEVSIANALYNGIEKGILKQALGEMSLGELSKKIGGFSFKNFLKSQIGPFDEEKDGVPGLIGNWAFWTIGGGAVKLGLTKTVGTQRARNWIGNLFTKFTKTEKSAIQEFIKKGQSGELKATVQKEYQKAQEKVYDAFYDEMKKSGEGFGAKKSTEPTPGGDSPAGQYSQQRLLGQPGTKSPRPNTSEYVDSQDGTFPNITEPTTLVNPTPGESLASTFKQGFTLKNGKYDKPFGIKEMLRDFEKLLPEEKAIAMKDPRIKRIIEIQDINNEVKQIEGISHPLTEEEALGLYSGVIDGIKKGFYQADELIMINQEAPKSIQKALKDAGSELLGRKPIAVGVQELPRKVLDIEQEIAIMDENMGDRASFVQHFDGDNEYGNAGAAYDAVKDMDRFEIEDYSQLWDKPDANGGQKPKSNTAQKILNAIDNFANEKGISGDEVIETIREGTGNSRYQQNLSDFKSKYGVAPHEAKKKLAQFKKAWGSGKNPSIDDFLYKSEKTIDFNKPSKEEIDAMNSKTPFDDEPTPEPPTPEKSVKPEPKPVEKTPQVEGKEFGKYKNTEPGVYLNPVVQKLKEKELSMKMGSGQSFYVSDIKSNLQHALKKGGHTVNLKPEDIHGVYTLDEFIDHPKLFEKYKGLKNQEIVLADFHTNGKRGVVSDGKIYLNSKIFAKDKNDAYSTLVHEIEHRLQEIRGQEKYGGDFGNITNKAEMEELAINIQNEFRKSVGLYERPKTSFDNPAPQSPLAQEAKKSSLPMGEKSSVKYSEVIPEIDINKYAKSTLEDKKLLKDNYIKTLNKTDKEFIEEWGHPFDDLTFSEIEKTIFNNAKKAGLSPIEAQSFVLYSDPILAHYEKLNNAIREGITLNPGQKLLYKKVSEGLSKLPKHNGIVYRGVISPKIVKEIQGLKVGEEFINPSFMSTSKSMSEAENFTSVRPNERTIMKIKSKNGRDISGFSTSPDEQEVLFNVKSKFKFTGMKDGIYTFQEL